MSRSIPAARRALSRVGRAPVRAVARRPRRVLGVAVAVALIGLVAGMFHEVTSDVRKLVPQHLSASGTPTPRTRRASRASSTSPSRPRPDQPAVFSWMTRFQEKVLTDHGYTRRAYVGRQRNPPELCPALSLADLFRRGVPQRRTATGAARHGAATTSPRARSAPTAGREPGFGIRLMPLDRQQKVIDDIKAAINDPKLRKPKGSTPGRGVAGARRRGEREAGVALVAAGTLVGSLLRFWGAVAAVGRRLWAARPADTGRDGDGWSGAVLFVLRIPLNPMSVTLGALVVAIATEFSVLICARYRRSARVAWGRWSPRAAYASTGAAVIASGMTAIAGFAVLMRRTSRCCGSSESRRSSTCPSR